MATHVVHPRARVPVHRIGVLTGVLVGLAILLVTQDLRGVGPYLLLVIAAGIAMVGYRRSGPGHSKERP